MAYSIGFSNFRQFKHFPAIPIKDITILVGCNNAGKSTLVKALLLMGDFFRKGDYITGWYNERLRAYAEDTHTLQKVFDSVTEGKTPRFYFDRLYNAHIGTFHRALCNHADSGAITFEYSDKLIKVEFTIEADPEDERATNAPITVVRITDPRRNVLYSWDYRKRQITVTFNSVPLEGYEDKTLKAYFANVPDNATFNLPMTFNAVWRPHEFRGILSYVKTRIDATTGEGKLDTETRERMAIPGLPDDLVRFLKEQKKVYDLDHFPSALQFMPGAEGNEIVYIYAHAISQNVVFSTKDYSNDYVSQTVHDFAEPAVQANENVRPFVQKWLKEFQIGKDYEIISIGGEAHVVNIISADGSKVNMADKGMGAIQLIVLLFRLAKIMTGKLVDTEHKLIVIEEPELNLHPSLQSKLADFFYIMNRDHHFRFIVETHSEYLVRKTQVFVMKDKLAEEGHENPFAVYYFDGNNTEKPYYEMKYQPDGAFENDFGEGFYDEAFNLAFEIL